MVNKFSPLNKGLNESKGLTPHTALMQLFGTINSQLLQLYRCLFLNLRRNYFWICYTDCNEGDGDRLYH